MALVLASLGDGLGVAIEAVGGGLTFAAVMVWVAPRLLSPLGAIVERKSELGDTLLAVCLVLFLLSAFAMDAIGIHAVLRRLPPGNRDAPRPTGGRTKCEARALRRRIPAADVLHILGAQIPS